MMKLKSVKDKSVDETTDSTNGNAPAEDDNNGTMVIK